MSDLNGFLLELLEEAAMPLPGVTRKKMFGCEALFADGTIFAMVWKEGRLAVKLPDGLEEALALPGADPWAPGGKKMGAWALLPETFHDDAAAIAHWVRRAHASALVAPPKPTKRR